MPTTVVEFTEERHTCDSQDDVDVLVTIPMMSVSQCHNICAICRVKIKPLVCMGKSARLSVFINQGVLLKEGVRCCKRHLNGKQQLKCSSIIDRSKHRTKHATIKTTQLYQLLENLRRSASMSSTRRLNFDDLDN